VDPIKIGFTGSLILWPRTCGRLVVFQPLGAPNQYRAPNLRTSWHDQLHEFVMNMASQSGDTQCFKTRPGGSSRVCGRARSKQKTGWELAWSTLRVDLGPGRPGQTRLRPGFIFFISSCLKRQEQRE